MALKEQDIVFTGKDSSGNTILQMPITRAANVEDLTSTCLPLIGGNVTGNLTVQSKNVVRSVNGVEANTSGDVTISTGVTSEAYAANSYCKLSNGLQVVYGTYSCSEDQTKTITFARAFRSAPTVLVSLQNASSSYLNSARGVTSVSATTVKIFSGYTGTIHWLAIGEGS